MPSVPAPDSGTAPTGPSLGRSQATRNYIVASELPPPPPEIVRRLRLETQLAPGPPAAVPLDPVEHDVLAALADCGRLGVVEVVRHLGRPAWLTRMVLSDLLDKGLIVVDSQLPDDPDRELLERLHAALSNL
jgi:hypothetical protein